MKARIESKLLKRANSQSVNVVVGSGTLTNDIVAGQISQLNRPGLILVNGEFGRRLVDHAARWQLDFSVYATKWGTPLFIEEILDRLQRNPDIGWIWMAHCETSTGMLNDLDAIKAVCSDRDLRLCLDCVSSFGCVPLDLSETWLATAVSSKGTGSHAGLGIVFQQPAAPVRATGPTLPRYLDLQLYETDTVPFTAPSNLFAALEKALDLITPQKMKSVRDMSAKARIQLENAGYEILVNEERSSPAVVTIDLSNAHFSSQALGDALSHERIAVSYQSGYLMHRGWLQLCFMGDCRPDHVSDGVSALTRHAESSRFAA